MVQVCAVLNNTKNKVFQKNIVKWTNDQRTVQYLIFIEQLFLNILEKKKNTGDKNLQDNSGET